MFDSLSTLYYAYLTYRGVKTVSNVIDTWKTISYFMPFTNNKKRLKDTPIIFISVDEEREAYIIDHLK